jgi:ABC-type protease/lipase transport system fused ATPase/permease subunit
LCMFVCLRTVYCVCLFVFVLCVVYVCLSSYCVLCMFVCLCTVTNKHTQYTVRRQTSIHNTQYEDKQANTMHSMKTNRHTQHTVRRQADIHNTTQKTEHMSNTERNETQGNLEGETSYPSRAREFTLIGFW